LSRPFSVGGVSSRAVGHRDARPRHRQPDPELAVLRQAVDVPSADEVQQVGPDEHGVAAERDEAVAGVEVQAAGEPEEVLQGVAERPPARAVVHELDAALHDVRTRRPEARVDVREELERDLVLGIEDTDDLPGAVLQRPIESLRLVLRDAVVDDDDDARVGVRQLLRDGRRPRVVVTDDDEDLQ
jgi:hypothetical protein